MKEVIAQLVSLDSLKDSDLSYKQLDFNCILIDERKLGLLLLKNVKFKILEDKEYSKIFTENINIKKSIISAIGNN